MSKELIRTSETDPIRVDYLPDDDVQASGRLGMTFAPGMWAPNTHGRWERNLAADLKALRTEHGTDALVSLMEKSEYNDYRIPELLEADEIQGIEILRFAIQGVGVPEETETGQYEALVSGIAGRVERGQRVVIHCRGGLGRTGTVAACVLVVLGEHTAGEAIDAVRAAREGTIQNGEQAEFVHRFERNLWEKRTS